VGRLVNFPEYLFKPSQVLFGLGLMFLEGVFKVLGLGGLRHFRQRREDFLLHEVDVF
jgi:hypothetical protein